MKQILSNKGFWILVDDEDYERLAKFNWYHRKKQIVRFIGFYTTIPISNEVMNNQSVVFDHKDRNYLNNQKENLRECSHQQNMCNKAKLNNSLYTSRYKGVSWNSKNKKWAAFITVNRKQIYLGLFSSEIEAAQIYNTMARKEHGEFAVLNNV